MDTTLLVTIAIAAVVLLTVTGGVVANRSGRFAIAGAGRGRSDRDSARVSAPAPLPAPSARQGVMTATSVLDRPVSSAPEMPLPFAPSAPNEAALAVERLQARMDARFDALERDTRSRLDAIARDMTAVRDASGASATAIEARQTAALREMRAELAPLMVRGAQGDANAMVRERRAEASAELYAMLARMESAISQVTNPVLLPGEAYAPPQEFFAEALAWENWKDVGERAFALADIFSARRLYLSDQTAVAVAGFITTLRGVLTRSVYPNLIPDATPRQLEELRAALGALAAELPKVRRVLENEFRTSSDRGPAA